MTTTLKSIQKRSRKKEDKKNIFVILLLLLLTSCSSTRVEVHSLIFKERFVPMSKIYLDSCKIDNEEFSNFLIEFGNSLLKEKTSTKGSSIEYLYEISVDGKYYFSICDSYIEGKNKKGEIVISKMPQKEAIYILRTLRKLKLKTKYDLNLYEKSKFNFPFNEDDIEQVSSLILLEKGIIHIEEELLSSILHYFSNVKTNIENVVSTLGEPLLVKQNKQNIESYIYKFSFNYNEKTYEELYSFNFEKGKLIDVTFP